MPKIRIRVACDEFSRSFNAGDLVTDLSELQARAMVEAGQANYFGAAGMVARSLPLHLPGDLADSKLEGIHSELTFAGGPMPPLPAAGTVPITSVQWTDPAAFGIQGGDPRVWAYDGANYRRVGGGLGCRLSNAWLSAQK